MSPRLLPWRRCGQDKIGPRLGHQRLVFSNQPPIKQKWQSGVNELCGCKHFNTVPLTTCQHPGIIMTVGAEDKMSPSLLSTSQAASVIAVCGFSHLVAERLPIRLWESLLGSQTATKKKLSSALFSHFHNLFALLPSSSCTHKSSTNIP